MSDSVYRKYAAALAHHAARVLPASRAEWARAMISEVTHVASDIEALQWSFGCVLASYRERVNDMTRSKVEISPWLLGLEVLACLGPVTLLWMSAMYIVVSTHNSATSILVPTVLGTIGPIALALATYVIVQRGSISSVSFGVLSLSFAALAAMQLMKSDAAWFAPDWRVLMLNSVLPCLVCAHLALISRGNRETSGATRIS